MTSPFIIREPSFAEQIAPGVRVLMESLAQRQQQQQFQQQVAIQQQQLDQRAKEQEQSVALDLLSQGIQQPGFEGSDEAKALEATLGVPGFSKAIGTARQKQQKAQQEQFDLIIEGIDADDKTKMAVRSSLLFSMVGGSAEAAADLFTRLAPEAPLSALDQARIQLLHAQTADLFSKMSRERAKEPTLQDQQAIAKELGMEFLPGVDYADIFETLHKRKDPDPRELTITVAMQLARQTDLLGRPVFSPESAITMAADITGSIFPSQRVEPQFSPGQAARVQAQGEAISVWQLLKSQGKKRKEIITQIKTEFREAYGPLLTEEQLNDIVERAEREVR